MTKLRMISVTDDVSKCDCCGKQNLKKTVVLTDAETNFPDETEVYYYGSQCAVNALRLAGLKAFKNHLTNAEVFKKAKQAEVDHRNQQQDQLIAEKKVILVLGRYLLPDVELNNVNEKDFMVNEIERRNSIYPCFA